jgi:hypothetical protein
VDMIGVGHVYSVYGVKLLEGKVNGLWIYMERGMFIGFMG